MHSVARKSMLGHVGFLTPYHLHTECRRHPKEWKLVQRRTVMTHTVMRLMSKRKTIQFPAPRHTCEKTKDINLAIKCYQAGCNTTN